MDKDFKKKILNALGDDVLRGALGRFGDAYVLARENAYKGYNIEEISDNIVRVKSYAASHLDEMLDQFEKEATARGAMVYRAKTAQDAKTYIHELIKKKNIKKIVKSKSMVSEEILLNDDLIADGIDVQETDLGEWIVQLAGQHPSHMVLPAIHMTKEEVATTFSGHLKRLEQPVIAELVKTARIELRKKFLEAEMGISGANIAVAETGTLMMLTNEGNGRLTTTLPPTHVFLVGIEKFVPKFEDATYILQALPKSATGQQITSYVSMVTGPTPAYYADGTVKDKEFHIVIIDNGRRKMYNDEKFKKTFQCIRCASCLNVCPAFQLLGGHVYGHIYTGGIGTILTNFVNSENDAKNPQNLCLQCGKCAEVCPGKLDIPQMILELRNRMGEKDGLPAVPKFALNLVSNRRLFHSMLRMASIAQLPFSKGKPVIRHLPMFLSGLTEGKSLPTVAKVPFRDVFLKVKQDVKNPKGKVAIYAGCLIDFVYPKIGEGIIAGLNEKGYEVVFPDGQSCCGAPATYMGDRENARKLAVLNIKAMEAEKVDYVVSGCPTCTHALIDSFKELVSDDPVLLARAEELSGKSRDFSKLLFDLGGLAPGGDGVPMKITYHDSCHLKRSMGVFAEPRKLLSDTAGVQLIEMKESDRCCGFAGSYSIKFPEISGPILDRKMKNIEETGADYVVVDCPGCLMQIGGGLDKKNPKIKVIHTAELLLEKRKNSKKKKK